MHLPETDALFGYACAVMRPQWDGEPVSALDAALALALTPPSIALIVLCCVALWLRNLWLALLLNALWLFWGGWHILGGEFLDDATRSALQIGCIGPSSIFLALGTAMCVATLVYTARRKRTAR